MSAEGGGHQIALQVPDNVLYPTLYNAADASSLTGQRHFIGATRIRLVALVLAATFGAMSFGSAWRSLPAVLAAGFFGVALITEVFILKQRPERQWYEGRAAAESAKTLAWRYMVGGSPLELDWSDPTGPEETLLDRFLAIVRSAQAADLFVSTAVGAQITDEMQRIRGLPLASRQEIYRTWRIEDQRTWYTRKAAWNRRRAVQWAVGLAALEAVGLGAAIARAGGWLDFDFLGIAGAIIAAGVAWNQTKQHQNLASAYTVAALELADISSRIRHISSEGDWSHFVDQAEEAISREHTLWRASHS